MIKYKLLFISLFYFSFIFSQYSWEKSIAEPIVREGINALYNYNFDKAITLLDSAIILDDLHPAAPFINLSAKWLKSQSEEGYLLSYDTINSEVERLIPIYNTFIEKFPRDPEYLLFLGSAYGMRARIALASKEWLSAFYSGYKGLRYILRAKDLDQNLIDIYMPIGLMEYFACLSLVPVQWGANLLGIPSNCSDGLLNLELAAEKSYYSWIEASNVLAYAYLHIERDFEKADVYISKLVDNFPGHPYFMFLKGELLAKTSNYKDLDDINADLINFTLNGSYTERNECELKYKYINSIKKYDNKEYSAALIETEFILNNYTMEFDWLLGFTYFLRGQIYESDRNIEKSIENYNKVLEMDRYYPEVKEAEQKIRDLKNIRLNP